MMTARGVDGMLFFELLLGLVVGVVVNGWMGLAVVVGFLGWRWMLE